MSNNGPLLVTGVAPLNLKLEYSVIYIHKYSVSDSLAIPVGPKLLQDQSLYLGCKDWFAALHKLDMGFGVWENTLNHAVHKF